MAQKNKADKNILLSGALPTPGNWQKSASVICGSCGSRSVIVDLHCELLPAWHARELIQKN